MECRLFPYTIYVRSCRGDRVSIALHSDTRCPQKQQLLPPLPEAKRLVTEFCREAFPQLAADICLETWLECRLRRLRERIRGAARRWVRLARR